MYIDPLQIILQSQRGTEQRSIHIGRVAGARFSSRDVENTRRELDQQLARDGRLTGATRTNPSFYRIGRYLLTQASEFEVQGPLTGGEAEAMAIHCDDDILITVGSDQCARELDPLFLYGGASPFLDSAVEKAKELHLPETVSEGIGDGMMIRLHDPILQRTIEHTFYPDPLGDDLSEKSK